MPTSYRPTQIFYIGVWKKTYVGSGRTLMTRVVVMVSSS